MTSGGKELHIVFAQSIAYPFDVFLGNEKIVAVGKVPDLAACPQSVANRAKLVKLEDLLRARIAASRPI